MILFLVFHLKQLFFEQSNQKRILIELTFTSLGLGNNDIDLGSMCKCGNSNRNIFFDISKTSANILLNNFTKRENDMLKSNDKIGN